MGTHRWADIRSAGGKISPARMAEIEAAAAVRYTDGAPWLLCALLGTAWDLDLWPSVPVVLVVTVGRVAWARWRR